LAQVTGKINKVSQFGIFLDVGSTRDALWATSQLPKPASEYKEGEEITGLTVIQCNPEKQQLAVSTKPVASDYNRDDVVSGKVTKILPFGVFVDIGASNDALAPARYLAKEPTEYTEGEEFENWKVLSTDPSQNKISVAETDGSSGSAAGRNSFDDLEVGQKIKGVVRRSTNFGVFVDIAIGRTDALLPGSLMTEGTNPEDFEVNKEIEVYVHNVNASEAKVTLGMEKPEDEGSRRTYQPDWIPPGDMLPDLKLHKLDDYVIDEEPIDYRAWEKKYPGLISFPKDGEKEVYFNVNNGGGHWHGHANMMPSTVHYMPVPMHLRKPDAEPPVIPPPSLDDMEMSYESGIKPEIHVKYRAPPLNDPNWVWYDMIPDGVDPATV
jgi:transcriptional accessory protein Tex/SPT6